MIILVLLIRKDNDMFNKSLVIKKVNKKNRNHAKIYKRDNIEKCKLC